MSTLVYLIHFDTKYKRVQHYLGSTKDLAKRLSQHGTSKGARLLQVITENGIGYEVVKTWNGGFELEIALKKRKNAGQLCPKCNFNKKENINEQSISNS